MYIADGSTLLIYYNFNEIPQYDLMATLDLSNAIKDIAVENGYLYAAIGSDGVVAINLMVDVTPQIIDIYNTSTMANRLEIFDGDQKIFLPLLRRL